MKGLKDLHCACCGGWTRGKQYHNQDTGYGICAPCVAWIETKEGKDYIEDYYGKYGIHHSFKEIE